MIHYLKVDHNLWTDLIENNKRFEIRFDDRNYQLYDVLNLRCYHEGLNEYLPVNPIYRKVIFILYDAKKYGLQPGYVGLSIRPLTFVERIKIWL